MSGPRDNRPTGRRRWWPNSTGTAGRLAGLYGYDHYDATSDQGTVWSVARLSLIRFNYAYGPTEQPSELDWQQAREAYDRQQRLRLDRRADRLIQTHPDLIDLAGFDPEADGPDDPPAGAGPDA